MSHYWPWKIRSKKGLATRKKLTNFFDVFKSAAMERNVEKMRNLTHPSFLSRVDKDVYKWITTQYFNYFNSYNKNSEIDEVRIEDISDKKLLVEWAVVPEKLISVSYQLNDGSGGGGFPIMVALHKGKWKWVYCKIDMKNLMRAFNASAKSDVKNAYTTAMAYFSDFPKGKIDMTKLVQSGFVKLEGVEMSATGNQSDFKITAAHVDGDKVYIINAEGRISVESK